ncbi:hypothetical protein LSUE1_G007600 [Lachnellula suecica]|uniref:Uncharacterized protein n=1 Tax=Lachnellula suecica TaxID=602035 RepID=A0A8T9C1N5_9HELO|nr:hypothetical protein LSUE1_G007600 [Lachnellula suecica]
MDCNRPPGFMEVMPLGETQIEGKIDATAGNFLMHTLGTIPRVKQKFGPEEIQGARICITSCEFEKVSELKAATVGGVLRGRGKYYIMTVAHAFPGYRSDISKGISEPSEFEYDIDSENDDDEADSSVIETTSRGSMSSGYSESEDSKSSDESSNLGSTVLHSQQLTAPASGDPPIFSFEGQRPTLDYALIEILDQQGDQFVVEGLETLEKEGWEQDQQSRVTTVNVLVKVSPQETLKGQLLAAPTYLPIGGSYRELWTVSLQGTLGRGHCGSWVSDAATGKIYGHLVAGSPETGSAYVVPFKEVICDLNERFGGEWEAMSLPSPDLKKKIAQEAPKINLNLVPEDAKQSNANLSHLLGQSHPAREYNPSFLPTETSNTYISAPRENKQNAKKVHYTAGTKGKSSSRRGRHNYDSGIGSSDASDRASLGTPNKFVSSARSSRDSGVGASSASDRASLNTFDNTPLNTQKLYSQRHSPTALGEALDAANETISELVKSNEQLKQLLYESNKENRALKIEKNDLIKEAEHLGEELDHERRAHDKPRREVGRPNERPIRRREEDEESLLSQDSGYDSGRRYIAPNPPANNAPNPFSPLPERPPGSRAPAVTYAPNPTYAPAPMTAAQYARIPKDAARTVASSSGQKRTDATYNPHPI